MAYKLEPQPGDPPTQPAVPAPAPAAAEPQDDSTFRVSADPVVENGNGHAAAESAGAGDAGLPSSYGSQSLYLMARDPHSLFAYWDIDWAETFREQKPRDRKVHLRVSRSDGEEEAALEVEPMAGSCYVEVTSGDEQYTAEIGYYEPPNVWHSVAISMPVATPPDSVEQAEAPDFATVPFHLSFQRMIDLFRVSKHENASLTAMLTDLRQRATSESGSDAMTQEEREIVQAIDDAVAESAAEPAHREEPDLWVQQNLERILGFGRSGTSPEAGFGGGS
jgi:hypothetical protein